MAFSYSWLSRSRRLGGITALVAGAAIVLPASGANAAPATSEAAVKKKLEKLNSQVDKLANEYNKAKTQLDAAKKRLSAISGQVSTEKSQYRDLRVRAAQVAITAYKNGTLDSTAFLSSEDPSAALQDMSAFTALSHSRSQMMTALLASAQRFQRSHEEARSTLRTVATSTATLKKKKATAEKAIAEQKALLAKISRPKEPAPTGGGSVGSGSGTGSASSAAGKAVNYATAQLGKPYVFGGTGPSGFDCSGLTMMAWRAAGVSLPRVVPDQYNAITHVTRSNLRAGDLVFFDSLGHEGIYVGGGRFIHAPHTGTTVQYASISNPYWVSHFVGAGRP